MNILSVDQVARFLAMSDRLRGRTDNAFDGRSCVVAGAEVSEAPVRFTRHAELALV